MKIRYYKLQKTLKNKKLSPEGLRRRLGLLPTEIGKIETNRRIGFYTLLRTCALLDADIPDILETQRGDDETFFNERILRSHSYVPKGHIKKEFIKDTDAQ